MKVAFFLVLLLAMASVMVDAFVVFGRRRKAKRAVDEALKALEDAKRACDEQIAKWEEERRNG